MNVQSLPRSLRRTLRRCALVACAGASALAVGACGGPQEVRGGEEVLTAGAPSMMGALELEALAFVEDMTLVLASNQDDPVAAVERMRAFLTVNQGAMMENATGLREQREGLSDAQARLHEAQFASHLSEAHQAWRDTLDAFRRAHPDAAREIEGLVARVDAS